MAGAQGERVPLLLISGPVGVGKTTVGYAVSDLLCEYEVSHTFIDLDQLRYTYPRPVDDRFGSRLGLQNLRDIWRNATAAGSRNLVLAGVIETEASVAEIRTVVPNAEAIVCQLRASKATLEARVRKREIGKGLDWHLKRAVELSEILTEERVPMDFEVWTDAGTVDVIAQDIVQQINWMTSQKDNSFS